MTDGQITVASAVVVPDLAENVPAPSYAKRRQSSISEGDSKRPRLSTDGDEDSTVRGPATGPPTSDGQTDRRRSRQLEEKKRGQRLFGALLGTLSQSSSSAAQKRRADIERKQQAKLKLQEEEFDQKKKEQLEELLAARRKEQKLFDEQSMRIRHSSMLAVAHFLQTKTKPKLYYKPWELRPEEEEQIKRQIDEAEALIDEELDEFERRLEQEQHEEGTSSEAVNHYSMQPEPSTTVGPDNDGSPPLPKQNGGTNHSDSPPNEEGKEVKNGEKSKDAEIESAKEAEAGDDRGEMLISEEDTVMY